MLGAHALRAKQEAERRERDKKDRAKELQIAAKKLVLLLLLLGSRAHSIYDFALLSARSATEQRKNKKIKSRFSLNFSNSPLLITRELPTKYGRNASSGSIHSLLLLTPKSFNGHLNSPEYKRKRTGSSQSARSAPLNSTKSVISSAGSKLLKWFGIGNDNNSNEKEKIINLRNNKNKEKKYKRRISDKKYLIICMYIFQ
ncbi:hypothetical protein Mgra_00003227 [Meloidogyne graminicola]|uniref:Uncharacterized protein n=1 Tax=Meloidogyne graminicola TaxID=189291 RepID=A0A8S9ZWD0_9BILA|nr:hypothetical protein Mgra_00003227 [Meloidogyne graminicola]